MDEYISREAVLKAFKLKVKNRNKDYQRGMQDAIDCLIPEVIADIPSADVQSVKHGEWKINSDGYYPYCSVCGTAADQLTKHLTKFCPECGTRMDGDDV